MQQMWWEHVPHAMAFIHDIANQLLDEKSLLLDCSGSLPWYDYMVDSIKEEVRIQNSSKRIERARNIDDPGQYILSEYCKSEKRIEYRPPKSIARFLAENDDIVIHQIYLWVKVRSLEQLDAWSSFVSEYEKYRGRNKDKAAFVLEWTGNEEVSSKKGVRLFSFDNYITEYDRVVFCTLASAGINERPFIKNYLTELASELIGNDIELCAACIRKYRDFLNNPIDTVRAIVGNECRSNGDSLIFDENEKDVNHLVWLAQIKTVYPVLEEYREDFVQRHEKEIANNLPFTNTFGDTCNDPNDVELGTLKFMADDNRLNLSYDEYQRLRMFKDARNSLSHLTPLTIAEVKKLSV